jgi:hypothetical protein
VRFAFDGVRTVAGRPATFAKPARLVSFGSDQYAWRSDGPDARPEPDGPWVESALRGDTLVLPRASVSVVRGKLTSP